MKTKKKGRQTNIFILSCTNLYDSHPFSHGYCQLFCYFVTQNAVMACGTVLHNTPYYYHTYYYYFTREPLSRAAQLFEIFVSVFVVALCHYSKQTKFSEIATPSILLIRTMTIARKKDFYYFYSTDGYEDCEYITNEKICCICHQSVIFVTFDWNTVWKSDSKYVQYWQTNG